MSSTPTKLGKYQIIREIARSNDIVYEAYDPQMNRRVAVKELAVMKGASGPKLQERIDRFKREARAAGTISHPNIMTVYELGEDNDTYYIAMEFLDGHTLRNEIDTKGNLEVAKAIEIASEVLKGLSFAHSKGVIHRDVKPDNIQILSDGRIKLTDFGIARLTFEPNLTLDGQVFGTPSYMSPEQIVGKEIDARSDQFSLAAVLYEMVEGKKPFPGDSVIAITTAVTSQPPQPMKKAPYGLAQVIEKALEKVPSMRYANADDFRTALEDSLTTQPQPDFNPSQTIIDPYGQQYNGGNNYQANPSQFANAIQSPPPILGPYSNNYGNSSSYSPQVQPYGGQQYYGQITGSVPNVASPPPPDPAQFAMYQQMMATGQVPLSSIPQPYYPRPPRQGMKPETKQFFSKLFLAFLIGITVIIVVVLLFEALTQSVAHSQRMKTDQQIADQTNYAVRNLPLPQKISKLQDAQKNIQSPLIKVTQNQAIAKDYASLGDKAYEVRDYSSAENDFQSALFYDPQNQDYYSRLGNVYLTVANQVHDVQERSLLFNQTFVTYQKGVSNVQDQRAKQQFANGAAQVSVTLAQSLAGTGNYFDARQTLISASLLNPTDPRLSTEISQLLKQYQKDSIDRYEGSVKN